MTTTINAARRYSKSRNERMLERDLDGRIYNYPGDPLWRKAGEKPSLDLRFADSKSLVDATTGQSLVTFTRASEATFVNSQGLIETAANNASRFDHNPTTGESLGLLVEEQRTNLLWRSEEFDIAAAWGTQGTAPTVIANALTAPNGLTTADRITFAAADSRLTQGNLPITSGVTYTMSVYARSAGASLNKFRFAFFDQANQGVSADFTVSSAQWQRFTYSYTSTATNNFGFFQIRNASDNLANDLYFWGVQLEAGSFPTSYIPTTASAATRAADVASISGSNFSSWYRQDEGTVFADTASIYNNGRYFMFDNGTTNERWEGRYSSFLAAANSWSNNVQDVGANTSITTTNPAVNVRIAIANASSNAAIASNGAGATVGTDSSSTMPANQSRLFIGSFQGTATFANGPIRRLTYWPQRLGNEVLQRLTQ